MSSPELLILDEPTTGLDPQARQLFWRKLRQLKRDGMTMLLTTHYMEEAAQLCDRVIIMDESNIIARGTPRDLIAEIIGRDVVEVHFDGLQREEALAAIRARADGFEVEETEHVAFIFERDGHHAAALDLHALESAAGEAILRKASLEDVFLRLTGREIIE
jgi:lipooligosaccharide transport system ATP-binding protein